MTLTSYDLSDEEVRALTVAAQGHTLATAAKHLDVGTRTYQRTLRDAQAKLGANGIRNAIGIAATARLIAVYPPGDAHA